MHSIPKRCMRDLVTSEPIPKAKIRFRDENKVCAVDKDSIPIWRRHLGIVVAYIQ